MKKCLSILIISIVFGLAWNTPAHANLTAGLKDLGFIPESFRQTQRVYAVSSHPNGNVFVGGAFWDTSDSVYSRMALGSLNANGRIPPNYPLHRTGEHSTVYAIAIQSDLSILVGGFFSQYAFGPHQHGNNIARVDIYGYYDTSFNPVEGTNGPIFAIAVQPDGKILIGGAFTTYDGSPAPRIARLNRDGSLDSSFNPGTGPDAGVSAIAVQPDGNILIGGIFNKVAGVYRRSFARLNSDGSLHSGSTRGFQPGDVTSIALTPDDKIIVGGSFNQGVVRLLSNGTTDDTFDPGSGANDRVQSVAVQPDGKVILGGNFTTFNEIDQSHITRLNLDGTIDHTFVTGEVNNRIYDLAIQPDGKVFIGGWFTQVSGQPRPGIARLHPDGTLDNGLSSDGSNGTINKVISGTDNKIYIGGSFDFNYSFNNIARLKANGTLDTSFSAWTNNTVHTLALLEDSKVLIGGEFTAVDGVARQFIARLNPTGPLDTSFDPGSAADDIVRDILVQPDSKLLVAGDFTKGIIRLNPDGSPDSNFNNSGSGTNNSVYAIALQPDGKILIAGEFTTYNGVNRKYVARLNENGSLDTSFNPATPDDTLRAVALQPDGKVLIGGYMENVGTTLRRGIARLNSNGSLDTSFDPGVGIDSGVPFEYYELVVLDILVQEDGMILIGGNFFSYDGAFRRGIARLKANGSVDDGFFPGSGVTIGAENSMVPGTVKSIALQPLAKVIIAGSFDRFFGDPFSNIVRLSGGTPPTITDLGDPVGYVGIPYESTFFTSTGFPLPTIYTSRFDLMPPGLTLSNEGVLSGIPSESGTFSVHFWACNYINCIEGGTGMIIKNPPPNTFYKTSPINGATNVPINPTLSWEASDNADSYAYCLGSSSGDCDTPWISTGSDQAVTLSGLSGNTTYYWQVQAVNDEGSTEANDGTWWSFTTMDVFVDIGHRIFLPLIQH